MVKINILDIEMGLLGAIGNGAAIALINLTGGWQKAIIAGAIQAIYSFLIIVFTNFECRYFVKKSLALAVIVPTLSTTILTFTIHTIAGSPEPLWSAVYAFFMALVCFIALAFRFKKTDKTLFCLSKECLNYVRTRWQNKNSSSRTN